MDRELNAACQRFLIPASVLLTALGIASTKGLKAGISLIAA